jgi:hypothetical protein
MIYLSSRQDAHGASFLRRTLTCAASYVVAKVGHPPSINSGQASDSLQSKTPPLGGGASLCRDVGEEVRGCTDEKKLFVFAQFRRGVIMVAVRLVIVSFDEHFALFPFCWLHGDVQVVADGIFTVVNHLASDAV